MDHFFIQLFNLILQSTELSIWQNTEKSELFAVFFSVKNSTKRGASPACMV